MSYSILYRSMFVKVRDDKYIPMVECGDNNVWDYNYGCGRAKRSRSWCNLGFNGIYKKFFTHNDLLDGLNGWEKRYNDKRIADANSEEDWKRHDAENGSFGYYMSMAVYSKKTHGTTFNAVKNLILSGEKIAVPFDFALNKLGLHIIYYDNEDDFNRKEMRFHNEDEMYKIVGKELKDKQFWFVYDDSSANKYYNILKATKGFAKLSGKGQKYFVSCEVRDSDRVNYLAIDNNGTFYLTEDIKKAAVLDKEKSSGYDIFNLIWDLFDGIIYSIHRTFEYNDEFNKIKEAA